MPIINEDGVLKYPNKDRKGGGPRTQDIERYRKKPIKLSDEDLAKRSQQRSEYQGALNTKLDEVRENLWKMIEELHQEFPKHTEDWFYRTILQLPKHKTQERRISNWQAFVALDMEEHNEGTLRVLSAGCSASLLTPLQEFQKVSIEIQLRTVMRSSASAGASSRKPRRTP